MVHQRLHGKWWLVTWTTFGTWLPGDPRGFQTFRGREHVPPPRRYAKPGEEPYDPEPYRALHESARQSMSQPPIHLTPDEAATAWDAVMKEADEMPGVLDPAILAVDGEHAHLLAKFAREIRPTVGRLKAAASRRLHREGFAHPRVWVRGCHMKSKPTPREVETAFEYVASHRHHGACVYVWRIPDYENEC